MPLENGGDINIASRGEPCEGVRLRTAAAGLVMGVIAVGAAAKLFDAATFARSLGTWSLIPGSVVPAVALAVPGLELQVAGLWLVGIERRRMVLFAIGMISAFTVAYLAHLLLGRAPECACLGKILAFTDSKHDAAFIVGRNTALLAMLGFAAMPSPRSIGKRGMRRSMRRSGLPLRPGITLMEAVIVVAMLALLTALMLPSLSRVRQHARGLQSLSNLRSHAIVFGAYTTDWSDVWPYITDRRATYTILRADGIAFRLVYFDASHLWNIGLADAYYGEQARHKSFFDPGSEPGYVPDYLYSSAFLADPDFWRLEARTGPEQWRPTRTHEVQFPAAKALLLAPLYYRAADDMEHDVHMSDRPGVAAADGSARRLTLDRFGPVYPKGEGHWHGASHRSGFVALHTIGGVRGRDLP